MFVARKSNLHNKDTVHEETQKKNKWLQSAMQHNFVRLQALRPTEKKTTREKNPILNTNST